MKTRPVETLVRKFVQWSNYLIQFTITVRVAIIFEYLDLMLSKSFDDNSHLMLSKSKFITYILILWVRIPMEYITQGRYQILWMFSFFSLLACHSKVICNSYKSTSNRWINNDTRWIFHCGTLEVQIQIVVTLFVPMNSIPNDFNRIFTLKHSQQLVNYIIDLFDQMFLEDTTTYFVSYL